MKVFSLFSGIGGFDLAFQNKGHTIIGACEIDKYARSIYTRQFPKVKIYQDARKINPKKLEDFECLTAGFPCKTFSIAGKRLGFKESQGTLFFEIARITKEKRPKLLLLENVKGLLSHDKGKTFAVILSTLAELGYNAEWQVLNSQCFIQQNRERIFIVGYPREEPRPKIFPIGSSIKKITSSRHKIIKNGSWIKNKLSGFIDGQDVLVGWSKSTRAWGVQQRFKINEANTLNTGEGCSNQSTCNYIIQKNRMRRLTPLECERLQGFPDNYTKGLSDTQRYKCLGNAVTVPVIECIVERINSNTFTDFRKRVK